MDLLGIQTEIKLVKSLLGVKVKMEWQAIKTVPVLNYTVHVLLSVF